MVELRNFMDLTEEEIKEYCSFAFPNYTVGKIEKDDSYNVINVRLCNDYNVEYITLSLPDFYSYDCSGIDSEFLDILDVQIELWLKFLFAKGIKTELSENNPFLK